MTRRILATVTAMLAGSAALAADPEMARCLLAKKASARLDCFESLARQRNDVVEAPASSALPPAALASQRRTEFGLSAAQREERKPVKEQQLERLTATVVAIRPFGAGLWSFLTEDGATWRITEARQQFRPPAAGDTVALQRGALGSYLLIFDHQPGIRAKRLN